MYKRQEDEFTFLFKKPKAASYDRYVKTMSNSVTKASKSFAFDNIIDEQRDTVSYTHLAVYKRQGAESRASGESEQHDGRGTQRVPQ